jgi:hypothetical protein
MKLAETLLVERALQARVKEISDLPTFQWKTPLQRVIQILKRHRDVMYERDPDRKPSSIIITTLAAGAYQGEVDVPTAIVRIVDHMEVRSALPRVPNPVNPQEDFTDKWRTPQGRRLRLEDNFVVWAQQAKKDLQTILYPTDQGQCHDLIEKKFGVKVSGTQDRISGAPQRLASPAVHVIRDIPPKPWCV